MLYSTPACYAYALHSVRPASWPEKSDDFMPYEADAGAFWTGFYSSRPALKRYERLLSAFLTVRYELRLLRLLMQRLTH